MVKSAQRKPSKSAPKSTKPIAKSAKSSKASTKKVSKANSVASSPRKSASIPSKWNAGYTKEITLFKQQTDYF
jgi:hypothetical protein